MLYYINNSQDLAVILTLIVIVFNVLLLVSFNLIHRKYNAKLTKTHTISMYSLTTIVGIISICFICYFFNENWIQDVFTLSEDWIEKNTIALISMCIVTFFAYVIAKVITLVFKKMEFKEDVNQRRKQTLAKVIFSIVKWMIFLITIIVLLALAGFDVKTALAGLGIIGLVIGLGSQQLIKDLIAGIILVFEHHFDVGDVIEVNGFKGTVIDVSIRSTKIKNSKNEIMIVTNGTITKIINFSHGNSVAEVMVLVDFSTDVNKAKKLLLAAFEGFDKIVPNAIAKPTVDILTDFNTNGLTMKIKCNSKNCKQYSVELALRSTILEVFSKENIKFSQSSSITITQK